MLLQEYIRQIIAEAISTDAAYKQHIKSLFEQWIAKFSDSYAQYRKQNTLNTWVINSISYVEDYKHQHIELLFEENRDTEYAYIFEHDRSIYVANDKALGGDHGFPAFAIWLSNIAYWRKRNYAFKLSISDFETALDVADNFDEFIALCEELSS